MTDEAHPDPTGPSEDDDRDDDHLREVPDGAGCTEIWEHLSERREAEPDGGSDREGDDAR